MIRALVAGDARLEGVELSAAITARRRAGRDPRVLAPQVRPADVIEIFAALLDRAPLILHHPKRSPSPEPSPSPGAAVCLETSGSTGAPRWIEHRRSALLAHAGSSVRALETGYDDVHLVCLPLAHVSGLAPLLRASVSGGAVALLDAFDPRRFTEAVSRHRATITSLVPTMLVDLVAARWRPPAHLRAVLIGGAACPVRVLQQARDLAIPVITTYGMTETFSHVALDGRLLDGVEARIDAGGRLELLTPASAAWPGWLTTGDLATLSGRDIIIAGRADHLIVTGGENVSPDRVEGALVEDASVESACVVGIPDPRWGQMVAAAITPASKTGVRTDRLDATLRESLASFERPRRYLVLDAIPLDDKGAPDRARVAAAIMSSGSPPTS